MSEKLDLRCDKCAHKAGSHNINSGKHECLVFSCHCKWFKLPTDKWDKHSEEVNDDGNSGSS